MYYICNIMYLYISIKYVKGIYINAFSFKTIKLFTNCYSLLPIDVILIYFYLSIILDFSHTYLEMLRDDFWFHAQESFLEVLWAKHFICFRGTMFLHYTYHQSAHILISTHWILPILPPLSNFSSVVRILRICFKFALKKVMPKEWEWAEGLEGIQRGLLVFRSVQVRLSLIKSCVQREGRRKKSIYSDKREALFEQKGKGIIRNDPGVLSVITEVTWAIEKGFLRDMEKWRV